MLAKNKLKGVIISNTSSYMKDLDKCFEILNRQGDDVLSTW